MLISIKPLSVNKAFQGKKYKTKDYKEYEKAVLMMLPPLNIEFKEPLSIELTFGFSSKISDIDNPVKPILDCLCKKYGFDDRIIYEMKLKKEIVKKGEEFIEIKIR
jgi:Holliday junction resolvase RusA-like endonuclease